jgi:pilus assembly protein CpaB
VSSRRTLILIAAILIGGIAAFTLFRYVNGVEDEAYGKARRVEVYVVKQDIPKALPGDQAISDGYVAKALIPQEFRPATAVTDIQTIKAQVAVNQLSAGQVVVTGMFVEPSVAYLTKSELIPDGNVAITVSVDQTRGVAGLVVPGDRVNLMIDDPRAGGGEGRQPKVILYQNVQVLFVGQEAAPQPGETAAPELTATSGLLTFAVPQEAASRIAYVGGEGLYLTLVPPDNTAIPVPAINADNLIDDDLTPYGDNEL